MKKYSVFVLLISLLVAPIPIRCQERFPESSVLRQKTFSNNEKKQRAQLAKDETLEAYARMRAERDSKDKYGHRPVYHFTAPDERLNDPNGFCYWNNNYHLFYQAYPVEDTRQHWGHAYSEDLIHWKDLPLAFGPGPENKSYSGSALVENDRVLAVYYGNPIGEMIAVSSDPLLLNWEKMTGGPVIPQAFKTERELFDPFMWKHGDTYYLLSGRFTLDNPGGRRRCQAFLWSSDDLINWKYQHPFIENDSYSQVGDDCACPYFLPIGNKGKYLLMHFSHINGSEYLIGNYDTKRNKFVVSDGGRINCGPVADGGTHAPSCFSDGKGGVVTIFNTKGKDIMPKTSTSCMTLPRLLTLDADGRLCQNVYGDYESLRKEHASLSEIDMPVGKEIVLDGISGKAIELELVFDKATPSVEVDVLRSPKAEEFTRIVFYRNGGHADQHGSKQRLSSLTIDTSRGSTHRKAQPRIPETVEVYMDKDEPLKLHIFIDRSIVEVFVNDRQAAMLRTYPVLDNSSLVSVRSLGNATRLIKAEAWQMDSIY